MVRQLTPYGFGTTVELPFDEAVQRTKDELAREGFGVLAEIDIAAALRKKLGADFRPYLIIGACNPPLAHRALLAEPEIGLLLPCNVVVHADDEPGRTVVAAMDPEGALALAGNAAIAPVAREAKARLERALERVEGGDGG